MARTAGKPARAPAAKKKATAQPSHREVRYVGLAAVGVLLLLSVYVDGAVGAVGRFISPVLVGLLGFGAYALPFAVIGAAVYALFSPARQTPPGTAAKATLLGLGLIAALHIAATPPPVSHPSVWAYLQTLYREGRAGNGGLLGALFGNLLRSVLGTVGAYIVLAASSLIAFTLLSGRSLVSAASYVARRVRAYMDELREQRGWDEAYEYEEDEEADEEVAACPPRETQTRPAAFTPPAPPRRKVTHHVVNIEDKKTPEPKRVLLFNEEVAAPRALPRDNPLFASRRIQREAAPGAAAVAYADDAPPWEEAEANAPAYDDYETYTEAAAFLDEPAPFDPAPAAPRRAALDKEAPFGPAFDEEESDDEPPFDANAPFDENAPFDPPPAAKPAQAHPSSPPASPGQAHPTTQAAPPDFTVRGLESKPKAAVAFDTDDSREAPPVAPIPLFQDYEYPPLPLLTQNPSAGPAADSRAQILENSRILEETLKSFKVEAKVVEVSVGPTVTRYDLAPGPGVKVATIANLSNDLALGLAAQGIRIEAPVPGKSAVGIEIPNKDPQPVLLREIIEDDSFGKFPSRLAFAVGKDIAGSPVVTDIARMPHLLIAGATGSGKSVCINTLIASLLYKSRPDEVKLLMIDPKVVELSVYNGIPHLLIPVVTDPKKASGALSWAVGEMENRYNLFAEAGTRDLRGYNTWLAEKDGDESELPQIVIIIDELADLMMVCKGEVEESICRLAQKARACGIHLIVATQRPSVDVITGLIKANIPSRLAFAVSSGTDSRTVLDMYGAEKLLGKGDMLFLPMGKNKPIRLQGGFISDKEVEGLVTFLKAQAPPPAAPEMEAAVTSPGGARVGEEADEFFRDAVSFLLEKGKASTSMLQRQFRIGYNRASRLMEELETRGIVGPEDGVKPRKVLITREEYIANF